MNLPEKIYPIEKTSSEAFELECKDDIEKMEYTKTLIDIQKRHPNCELKKNTLHCTVNPKYEFAIILLPLYLAEYTYNNKTFKVVITGSQEMVEGTRPIGSGWVGRKYREVVNTIYQASTQ